MDDPLFNISLVGLQKFIVIELYFKYSCKICQVTIDEILIELGPDFTSVVEALTVQPEVLAAPEVTVLLEYQPTISLSLCIQVCFKFELL